jgi:hypothetical protein
LKNYKTLLWVVFGAAYGFAMRVIFVYGQRYFDAEMVSAPFLLGTPFAIGAITVYGLRQDNPSILKMIFMPWISILLTMAGVYLALLEGLICIILAAPLVCIAASIGGLIMGLLLRYSQKQKTTLNSFMALPLALMVFNPVSAPHPALREERVAVEIAASPHRIWEEILNARDIRKEELPPSFTHLIGVPRPVEGINVMTPEGEVRHSKWERGVNFDAFVTDKMENRTITWRYGFTPASFPKGSMDEHVRIGGKYFDLYDTTFNLIPISVNLTRLEIVSHYRVTTDINFYGVPVAQFIAHDFMSTILQLYKRRSEKTAG